MLIRAFQKILNLRMGKLLTILGLLGLFFVLIYAIVNGGINGITLNNNRYGILIYASLFITLFFLFWLVIRREIKSFFNKKMKAVFALEEESEPEKTIAPLVSLVATLQTHYSKRAWQKKYRWIVIVGEETLIDDYFPIVKKNQWEIQQQEIFIWGGIHLDKTSLKSLKNIVGRKGVDAILWLAVPTQDNFDKYKQVEQDKILWHIAQYNRLFKRLIPTYLVDIFENKEDPPPLSEATFVNVFFVKNNSIKQKIAAIKATIQSSVSFAMKQLINCSPGLLQLLARLENKDFPLICNKFALFENHKEALFMRGYSAVLANPSVETKMEGEVLKNENIPPNIGWQNLLNDCGKRHTNLFNYPLFYSMSYSLLLLSVLFFIGMSISTFYNTQQLKEIFLLLNKKEKSQNMSAQLTDQRALQAVISQLRYRKTNSIPWQYRFGLSQNDALLTRLWGSYYEFNNENILSSLHQKLLTELQQSSTFSTQLSYEEQKILAEQQYNRLEIYLMMTRAQYVEAEKLTQYLSQVRYRDTNISLGDWHSVVVDLLNFYSQNLASHPEWKYKEDSSRVAEVRSYLVKTLGIAYAEERLLNTILLDVKLTKPEVTLPLLLNNSNDNNPLFSTAKRFSSLYTRDIYENQVARKLSTAVRQQKAPISWVLEDTEMDKDPLLEERLTERYFKRYNIVWRDFLNSIVWHQKQNLSEIIEQLTLIADSEHSPVIALVNAIQYQSALFSENSLLESVNFLEGAKEQRIERRAEKSRTIVQSLSLDGKKDKNKLVTPFHKVSQLQDTQSSNGSLTLQAYLNHIVKLRLTLQQIEISQSKPIMSQLLVKKVFQGKSNEFSVARDYADLVAASLEGDWHPFGTTLFVAPVENAWRELLRPAVKSFNQNWQESIVTYWDQAFEGRYPFKRSPNDASLAELARFLRPNSGTLDTFIRTELHGLLIKRGTNWVPNEFNSRGLRINPSFLAAINQLSQLSYTLFVGNDAGFDFEIMPNVTRGVTKTELIIDDQKIVYFNQRERWQSLRWPGNSSFPRAQLNWSATHENMQIFDDLQGSLAFLRLLERARVKQLDSNRFQLNWIAKDAYHLQYIMRTNSGKGPLAFMELRNFKLPNTLFLIE